MKEKYGAFKVPSEKKIFLFLSCLDHIELITILSGPHKIIYYLVWTT